MEKTFTVKVNDSFDFELSSDEISALDAIETSANAYHILKENIPYKSEIIEGNFHHRLYKVKVNNTSYKVNIHNDLDKLIKELGFEIGVSKMVNEIKAPMPGLILDLMVKKGDSIKENDPLLILEAMKMENIIQSPRDAVIKAISIKKGDAVDKNQLLIEFE